VNDMTLCSNNALDSTSSGLARQVEGEKYEYVRM
jgi:hypothetical protein